MPPRPDVTLQLGPLRPQDGPRLRRCSLERCGLGAARGHVGAGCSLDRCVQGTVRGCNARPCSLWAAAWLHHNKLSSKAGVWSGLCNALVVVVLQSRLPAPICLRAWSGGQGGHGANDDDDDAAQALIWRPRIIVRDWFMTQSRTIKKWTPGLLRSLFSLFNIPPSFLPPSSFSSGRF